MDRSLVTVYRAATLQDAYLLRNRLAEEGIEAVVDNAVLSQGSGVDLLGFPTSCRVSVAKEDEERALELAEEFEQAVCGGCQGAAQQPDEPLPARPAPAWPVCPQCGAARSVVCPFCQATADCFPLADDFGGSTDAEQPLQLLCPTCDEPHEARFLPECGHCGYRFSADEVPAPQEDRHFPAALYVGLAIVIGVPLAIVAYVFWLLR